MTVSSAQQTSMQSAAKVRNPPIVAVEQDRCFGHFVHNPATSANWKEGRLRVTILAKFWYCGRVPDNCTKNNPYFNNQKPRVWRNSHASNLVDDFC